MNSHRLTPIGVNADQHGPRRTTPDGLLISRSRVRILPGGAACVQVSVPAGSTRDTVNSGSADAVRTWNAEGEARSAASVVAAILGVATPRRSPRAHGGQRASPGAW